jgi:signal-transduction protein with cAMP-binding, CBS, and nucleotidyltransferase domain
MAFDPTVAQAKRYGVITCRPKTPLGSVAQLMAEEDISTVVVVDEEDYLAGIITRTDLLRAHGATLQWAVEPTTNWMTHEVITVTPHAYLSQVRQILLDHRIRRVVATLEENGKKRPVAVVSTADLVYHMTKELHTMVE